MKTYAVICAVMLLFLWRFWSMTTDYEREMSAHAQTRTELTAALSEARNRRMVAGENLVAAEAQKQLAEACLAREAEARADEEARKAILAPTKPRPRTVEEKDKVVDDETRIRVTGRLNRPL